MSIVKLVGILTARGAAMINVNLPPEEMGAQAYHKGVDLDDDIYVLGLSLEKFNRFVAGYMTEMEKDKIK